MATPAHAPGVAKVTASAEAPAGAAAAVVVPDSLEGSTPGSKDGPFWSAAQAEHETLVQRMAEEEAEHNRSQVRGTLAASEGTGNSGGSSSAAGAGAGAGSGGVAVRGGGAVGNAAIAGRAEGGTVVTAGAPGTGALVRSAHTSTGVTALPPSHSATSAASKASLGARFRGGAWAVAQAVKGFRNNLGGKVRRTASAIKESRTKPQLPLPASVTFGAPVSGKCPPPLPPSAPARPHTP